MQYRASTDTAWTTFWFEKNLQGDIVAVYSADGTKLISYNYNAWGIPFTTTHVSGTKAYKNPFRYRGYYYEESLGLYRTQTRLYDPYSGRFISPDKYASTGTGILGHNMYAYCNNNPVNFVDPSGKSLIGVLLCACFVLSATSFTITAVKMNLYAIEESEKAIENCDVPAMDDDTFSNYNEENESTYGMPQEKKIAYIRRIRQNNSTIAENWTEAEMLREMAYHDSGYEIAIFLGGDPTKKDSLADRLNHVNFEEEQDAKTYIFRFFGNMLSW